MLSVVMLAQAFMESFIWSVPICDVFLAVFQFAAGTWQTRLAFVTDDDGLFVPRCLYPDSLLVRRSFCLAWNFLEALAALVLGHRDVDLSEAQGGRSFLYAWCEADPFIHNGPLTRVIVRHWFDPLERGWKEFN